MDTQSLILEHISFAEKIACSKFRKTPPQVQLDELKSAAYMGLVDAARRYADGNFEAFASWRILGEIKDYLRSLRWNKKFTVSSLEGIDVPQKEEPEDFNEVFDDYVQRKISPLAKDVLKMYYGEEMSLVEIADKISMSAARVSQIIKENLEILRNVA
jgi:RNA polymerase sigma factor (sigma-70 family)